MDSDSYASTSRRLRAGSRDSSYLKAEDPPKFTPDNTFEIEDGPSHSPSHRRPWLIRKGGNFMKQHPRIARWIIYARGPRPPVELPDPIPLLDRNFHIKSAHIPLRVEPVIIRVTRPLTRWWIFVLAAIVYIIGYSFLVRQHAYLISPEVFTTCTATFWSRNAGCGVDGQNCLPFDNVTYAGRCPGQCSSVQLLNPRVIGNEEVVFKPLVVGGGDDNGTYRGDSFICAAAIHAGVISDSKGGCFNIDVTGNHTNFISSTANGLSSIGFPSVFPFSFRVRPNFELKSCTDLQTPALAFNVIATLILMLVLRPKPIVAYWSLVSIGYWHITFFSAPRSMPPPISDAFGSFLPLLFVAYGFWRLAFRFVLPVFMARAPLETAIIYLGPFWVGVLSNRTFERIPFQRLLPEDIKKQPGGVIAITILSIVIFVLAVNQIRVIRKTGWLPHYAGWYLSGGLVAMVLAFLPGLEFRLHHYFFAMAIMPATAFPTRLSAIYQGILLGLFLEGIAAYDFDSILQTKAELLGDATQGSFLPEFMTNSSTFNSTISLVNQTLSWGALTDDWDGFSLLIDDVERYAGTALNVSLATLQGGLPHFFRLAFTRAGNPGDFTMPATLWPNGTWIDPVEGAS